MTMPCEQIAADIGYMFACSEVNGQLRIRTPFLYPDGDVIDLFLIERQGSLSLTDFGETLRWLRMQTPSMKKSPKQRQLIEDVCLTHGIELFKGMLLARVRDRHHMAAEVTRLSQAAMRVADIWFTFRTRALETITDEVSDLLIERHVPFERNERIAGRSGRVWRPDFHTRMPARSTLVNVLTTGSRAAARDVAARVVASWYDLSHLSVGPEQLRFVSLFDDTLDVWTQEDFKLVADLSEVARWSKPDEFLQLLEAA